VEVHNHLLESYKYLALQFDESLRLGESMIKSIQSLNNLSTNIYTKMPDSQPFIAYSNSLVKVEVDKNKK
jgi:hypothetical protein